MYFVYSIILSIGFLLMLPMFLLRREKYASGFQQRLGKYPSFKHDERGVIWLHCVSVGETNAARPLVERLVHEFPDHRLVISTTTRTGHELAQKIFADEADAIVYFPFDWKFSVRRALETFKPSLLLLMETEIWPRFIRDAKLSGTKIAIVNGRLSQKSYARYSKVRSFVARVLADVDLAAMQNEADAKRITGLGMPSNRVFVTGNIKFEQTRTSHDNEILKELCDRFDLAPDVPLIIAASTHEPEERLVIESLKGMLGRSCRLIIAPRHPERFDSVEKLLHEMPYTFVRRSADASDADGSADVILLDSIGELRAIYPVGQIVFVGGSLIPHGGQSVLEPAASGRPVVTGPYTANFDAVVKEFLARDAIIQLRTEEREEDYAKRLGEVFGRLLESPDEREDLARNADSVMKNSRQATGTTVDLIRNLIAL